VELHILEVMVLSEQSKTCFFVTPIGADNSAERRQAEGILQGVLIPVLADYGFQPENIVVAHKIAGPGSITDQS